MLVFRFPITWPVKRYPCYVLYLYQRGMRVKISLMTSSGMEKTTRYVGLRRAHKLNTLSHGWLCSHATSIACRRWDIYFDIVFCRRTQFTKWIKANLRAIFMNLLKWVPKNFFSDVISTIGVLEGKVEFVVFCQPCEAFITNRQIDASATENVHL